MNIEPQALRAIDAAEALLARVLYAEAGQRPARAVEALAALALTRARLALACPLAAQRYAGGGAPTTLARALIAVLRAPFQFPTRHPRHPAHGRFLAPAEADPAMAVCARVARRALAGTLPDATGGAVLWHADAQLPRWAMGRVPSLNTGGLCFYAEGD